MEEFIFFHDFTVMVLVFTLGSVGGVIAGMAGRRLVHLGLVEAQAIECVWTLVPAAVLVQIAVPSLSLLYIIDEGVSRRVTLKAVGHQ